MVNDTGNDASVPPSFSVCRMHRQIQDWLRSDDRALTQLNVTLPRNAVAAYAELQASGNGNEEFWVYIFPFGKEICASNFTLVFQCSK